MNGSVENQPVENLVFQLINKRSDCTSIVAFTDAAHDNLEAGKGISVKGTLDNIGKRLDCPFSNRLEIMWCPTFALYIGLIFSKQGSTYVKHEVFWCVEKWVKAFGGHGYE